MKHALFDLLPDYLHARRVFCVLRLPVETGLSNLVPLAVPSLASVSIDPSTEQPLAVAVQLSLLDV